MIGSLRGKLLGFEGIKALIEVQGVGYEVEIPYLLNLLLVKSALSTPTL